MKILTVEGLKGTGKSLVIKEILREHHILPLQKFTKGQNTIADFLIPFRDKYLPLFKNIDSSLALHFYSAFFHNLENTHENDILLNRGLLSLPSFGYYGYIHCHETMPFKKYQQIVLELYDLALFRYKPFESQSAFFILECNEEEIKKRLANREIKIPSDLFFLEHFSLYTRFKEEFEKRAKKTLTQSYFFNLKNENEKDLVTLLKKIRGHVQ